MGRKKTKPEKPKAFEFNIGDVVYYIGGMYEKYENEEVEIIGRSKSKKFYQWYRIKILVDGHEITTPLATLRRKEDDIYENN